MMLRVFGMDVHASLLVRRNMLLRIAEMPGRLNNTKQPRGDEMANGLSKLLLWLALVPFCAPNLALADAPPAAVPTCGMPRTPKPVANGPITIMVNGATTWQPRGGEVLVEVSSTDAALGSLHYIACFTWDDIDAASYADGAALKKADRGADANDQGSKAKDHDAVAETDWITSFVKIRPSTQSGLVNLGVTVPPLRSSLSSLGSRWRGEFPSTGMGLVPVSYLRIIGYDKDDNVLADELRPIGITSIKLGFIIAVATVALALFVIHSLVGTKRVKTGGSMVSLDWLLNMSRMPDGRASLSGFQVLIWTLVIAGGSVYVMALSGDLVDLPSGALTVLGIAGAAKLLAANADNRAAADAARKALQPAGGGANPPQPPPPPPDPALDQPPQPQAPAAVPQTREPCWQDLILDPDTQTPNVSRMQMLLFTVVSAAFVLTQVLNYYVIPDIPTGYQILMGISNGIYVGRKFTG